MVVKTTRCSFTEDKIYPGHGVIFIRRDARRLEFGTRKAHSLYHTDRKPLNLRWCKQWRRAHKKENTLRQVKKEKRTKLRGPSPDIEISQLKKKILLFFFSPPPFLRSERGIEGLSLQKLLQKKNETETDRTKNREKKAAEEIKQRKIAATAGSQDTRTAIRNKIKALQAKQANPTPAKGGKGATAKPQKKEAKKGGAQAKKGAEKGAAPQGDQKNKKSNKKKGGN
ncbi:60S ribosomal protein L24 [Reticulomyxa filosa]|uniref:60S ribosomal protein L24 n=1 Tax=Reticulomyxa filosa TaxID=46433 RepID=X6MIQ6_RETFI|nr:60S ribosomal protein L24 [Reticulomyxa filosa]|eukprot:ETO12930.1 60S ribosomal protein L24 [Reticulomyxa filosa]